MAGSAELKPKLKFKEFWTGAICTLCILLAPTFLLTILSNYPTVKRNGSGNGHEPLTAKIPALPQKVAFVTILPDDDFRSNYTLARFENLVGSIHKHAPNARLFVYGTRSDSVARKLDAMENVVLGGAIPDPIQKHSRIPW